jgi:hypothetical protein
MTKGVMMAFEILKPDTSLGRRALIAGPPNSRKTSSLVTWPHTEEEGLHILLYPGEKGWDSIDTTLPGVHAYKWTIDDPAKINAFAIVKEVEQVTVDILSGKYGKVKTFAGDGIHKLYQWYYRKHYDTIAASGKDMEKEGGKAYGLAHEEFLSYLHRTCHSNVPYAVFTVWDGAEKDNAEDKSKDASTHIYPELPGKLAKRIMGEFGVVLYASVGLPPAPGKPAPATWQLLPAGRVWGAGVKVPARIAMKLPQTVPQDWSRLEPLLTLTS